MEKLYQVGDWSLWADVDDDGDCRKILHEARGPDGQIVSVDWNSWEYMPVLAFGLWLKLGMPSRRAIPHKGNPLYVADLVALNEGRAR